MAYFKINNIDFSMYVNKLKLGTQHNYKGDTTALGLIQAQYKSTSRILEVGIIPLDAASLTALLTEIDKFAVQVTFLDPKTNQLTTMDCIIPQNSVEYYTIQADKVMLQAFTLTFTEALIRNPLAQY